MCTVFNEHWTMMSGYFHVRLLYSRKRTLLCSINKRRMGPSTVCPGAMEDRKYLLLLPRIKLRCSVRVTPSTVTVPPASYFTYRKPASVLLPETSHTFLALLYRQFRDKNSAIVAASRWFSDATTLEDTARTLVTKILDKPRYTSRRECAAHFNAY
jgi:hypothetical protein